MHLPDLQKDPAQFRDCLLIDSDEGPAQLGQCMDAWQQQDFAALDSGWQRTVLGARHKAKYQRAWLERPRGHSKSMDIGIMAAWALFASRRRLSGIAAAGDQDQARLLRDAIGKLVMLNPWLSKVLEVQNNRVVNLHTESTLEIITSDAATSYGLTPDFVICDEIVHWKKRDLWDSLLSSSAKRKTCMLVIITNAGIQDDWQWQLREAVRQDRLWYFNRLDEPCASWMTEEQLAEQQRLLPPAAFDRLWLNVWVSGGGDALDPATIEAAFKDINPHRKAASGFEYVAGVDAGVSRDASALCILGVRRKHQQHATIQLAFTQIWKPTKGTKVDLGEVEAALVQAHERFNLKQINYDPWEMRYLASRLQAGNVGKMTTAKDRKPALPLVEVTQTGNNLQRMASAVLEGFNDYRVALFEDPDLRRDLYRFRVVERSYGFRIESPRDQYGHGDMGSAFQLAMLAASDLAGKRIARAGAINFDSVTPDDELEYLREQQEMEAEMLAKLNANPEPWTTRAELARMFRPPQEKPKWPYTR